MNVIDILNEQRNPYIRRARRHYQDLDDRARERLERDFQRHARACERNGIKPDWHWIAEAVEDEVKGPD